MGVVIDSKGYATRTSTGTISFNLTPVEGNRMIIAFVADINSSWSTPTFNGVSMSLVGQTSYSVLEIGCYYLLSPATGSQTLSCSVTITSGYCSTLTGYALSGVDLINNPYSLNEGYNSGGSTGKTWTLATPIGATCLLGASHYNTMTISPTEYWQAEPISGQYNFGSGYAENVSSTSTDIGYSASSGVNVSYVLMANPAPVSGGQPAISPFMVFFNRLKWNALWQPKGGLI